MSDEESWLDPAVLMYIQNNSGQIDSVDVVCHFQLRCDITLFAINRLKKSGKVEDREIYGNRHRLYSI